eukprot:scaffold499091_cov15-Prasinocladus_malaysianus.AAC.2
MPKPRSSGSVSGKRTQGQHESAGTRLRTTLDTVHEYLNRAKGDMEASMFNLPIPGGLGFNPCGGMKESACSCECRPKSDKLHRTLVCHFNFHF